VRRILENDTIRLLAATVFSQAILILSAPILSRIYPVSSFGVFGTIFSISSLLSTLITLKFETVILSQESDYDAQHFVFLSCFFAVLSILGLLVLSPFMIFVFSEYRIENLGFDVILLTCLVSLFLAINMVMQLYFNRKKMYNIISISYIVTAVLNVAFSLLLSRFSNGLSYAVLGANTVTLGVFFIFWRKELYFIKPFDFYKKLFTENFQVPKFAIPASLLNGIINQMPILFINFVFNSTVSGYFNLIQRTLGVPSGLFSKSLTVKYRQEIADEILNTKNGKNTFRRYTRFFLIISFLVFLPLIIAGDKIFVFAFGEQWLIAGQIARFYVIAIAINFIASPLANVLYITKRNDIDLIWHIIAALIMLAVFFFSWVTKQEYQSFFITLTCVYGILYVAYYVICYQVADNPALRLWRK
jgi:O-antigen/teichoic acid export membrane protein